jgi:hypothetical protein
MRLRFGLSSLRLRCRTTPVQTSNRLVLVVLRSRFNTRVAKSLSSTPSFSARVFDPVINPFEEVLPLRGSDDNSLLLITCPAERGLHRQMVRGTGIGRFKCRLESDNQDMVRRKSSFARLVERDCRCQECVDKISRPHITDVRALKRLRT